MSRMGCGSKSTPLGPLARSALTSRSVYGPVQGCGPCAGLCRSVPSTPILRFDLEPCQPARSLIRDLGVFARNALTPHNPDPLHHVAHIRFVEAPFVFSMTRTSHSLPDQKVFAIAGVLRPTEEWGGADSMVTANGCDQMANVHDRMPTILAQEDWPRWTDATPDKALALL